MPSFSVCHIKKKLHPSLVATFNKLIEPIGLLKRSEPSQPLSGGRPCETLYCDERRLFVLRGSTQAGHQPRLHWLQQQRSTPFVKSQRSSSVGALLDAELLAEVYLELIGARQASLVLAQSGASVASGRRSVVRGRPAPLTPRVTDAEREAHRAFVATLGDAAIWKDYMKTAPASADAE